MGQPNYHKVIIIYMIYEANRGNWNILVPRGRENKLMIPLVVASERGLAQTKFVSANLGL